MENRLKERLTGAAILVALIVVLVPEMFRGQSGGGQPKSVTSSSSGSSSGEGAPMRTYTIDLSNNPKSSGPLQSAKEAAPAATTTPTPAPPPAPAPATQASPPPAPAQSQPTSPAPAPKHTAPTPTPARVAPPPASAPKSAPAGTWSAQLGLFSKRENAQRMMNEAKAKGFNATVSSADAKGQFHVQVTGLTDRNAAQAMVQKLKGENLPAAVVAP
jgi:DedD protein